MICTKRIKTVGIIRFHDLDPFKELEIKSPMKPLSNLPEKLANDSTETWNACSELINSDEACLTNNKDLVMYPTE
ncbi:hypothetical protein WICPIJ_003587 [Wickerhamomyces pijperi]|uniref:Uncharacterized protein n=1 Tax=Wickerhamomyces pijperi TaxID=599730 RepID=A0A9P8TNQ4_WICPI|nr:hypothetical protein WICPIJ_003587 [Wickerhamomyces pijperi]